MGAFDTADTAVPATLSTFAGPGVRLLSSVATSHDRDSSPDPFVSGSAPHSGRRAASAPTASAETAAATVAAPHAANGTTGGAHAAPTTASINGSVLTTPADSTGEAGASTVRIVDAATTASYLTVRQATPAVTANTAAAAVAGGCPPLDRDATLDARCSPCGKNCHRNQRPGRRICRYQGRHRRRPAVAPEGRSSGPAPTSEPPTSPPRPTHHRRPQREGSSVRLAAEDCCVRYEVLTAPMVGLLEPPVRSRPCAQ